MANDGIGSTNISQDSADFQASISRLINQLALAKSAFEAASQIMSGEINSATTSLSNLENELRKNGTALINEAGDADKAKTALTNLGDSAKKSGGMLSSLSGMINTFKGGFGEINEVVSAFDSLGKLNSGFATQMSSLGKTFQSIMGDLLLPIFNELDKNILPSINSKMEAFRLTLEKAGAAQAFKTIIPAGIVDTVVALGNAVKNAFSWMEQHGPLVNAVLAGIGTAFAAFKIAGIIDSAVSAIKSMQLAMGALNIVMDANPIGIVVTAIGALVAAGVYAYEHWSQISAELGKLWQEIKSVTETVWNGLTDFFKKWGVDLLSVLAPVIGLPILISQHWEQIGQVVKNVWDGVKTYLSNTWTSIKSGVTNGVLSVVDTVKNKFEDMMSWIQGLPSRLLQYGRDMINGLLQGIKAIHIPLPHFSFSIDHRSIAGISIPIPDVGVNWYAQGGVFTQPSIIGVGENGSEAVVPLDKLPSLLAEALRRANGQSQQNLTINNFGKNLGPDDIIRALRKMEVLYG